MNDTAVRIIRRAPPWARTPLELVIRTAIDTFEDRVPGLAAEMAFYLVLSLPPLLLTVFGAVAQLGDVIGYEFVETTREQIASVTGTFLTADATSNVQEVLNNVEDQAQGALLSFGFLVTILSGSRALRVTTIAISIAYDLEATRPGWQQALYGVLLTIGGILGGVVVIPVLVAGPELGRFLAGLIGLEQVFGDVWSVLYWPVVATTLTLLLAVLYHVAAPWRTPWRRDLPGAVLAMAIGLLGSWLLRFYVTQAIGGTDSVFGPLAAPIVVLLWLYVMGFAVLLGAEFNAEIEKMWPTVHPDQPTSREVQRVQEAEAERVS